MHPTKNQAARAAVLIYLCLQFRRLIERQELEPVRFYTKINVNETGNFAR